MEVNDNLGYNNNSEARSRRWEISLTYALDGLNLQDLIDFDLGRRKDLEIIKLDPHTLNILKSFDLGQFTHYATSKENLLSLKNFLSSDLKFKLNEHLLVLLVLLCEGCWGLPKESQHSLLEEVKNNKGNFIREKKRLEEFKRLVQFLRNEVNHPDEYYINGIPNSDNRFLLEHIRFSFIDQENNSARETFQFDESDNNPIVYLILRYIDSMRGKNSKMLKELGFDNRHFTPTIDYFEKPHFLFCYRFIRLIYDNELLDFKGKKSYNKIYLAYVKLLRKAGYTINTYDNVEGTEIANIKKWFNNGLKIVVINQDT